MGKIILFKDYSKKVTLYLFLSKAYNYVGQTFRNSLDHPLAKWYYSIEELPGVAVGAFNFSKLKVKEFKSKIVVYKKIFRIQWNRILWLCRLGKFIAGRLRGISY